MSHKMIRVRLPIEMFLKYKVYAAINGFSMTQLTEHLLRIYIKEQGEKIKILNIENKNL